MKVLWIEDHEPVRDMLAVAADKAARARVQVDLVLAPTLMEAERRLRLERFDLVITELTLPDSFEGDMTIARIANMGKHRIAVATSNPESEAIINTAVQCGCNLAPVSIHKAGLPYNRFIQRPESMLDFFFDQMTQAEPAARGRIAAA
jgi:DNA-binding NarL/FixJ family response regulator